MILNAQPKKVNPFFIAENAVKDGFNELIAVGGDGTINEVGDVAIKNNLKLGVIPAGTGNDYMNSLNESCNFIICMEKIIRGNTIFIDYGSFADKSFFNVACVGFDLYLIAHMSRSPSCISADGNKFNFPPNLLPIPIAIKK